MFRYYPKTPILNCLGILAFKADATRINSKIFHKIKQKPKGVGNSITLPQNINDIEKLEELINKYFKDKNNQGRRR